jgi:hypothetical protein
MDDPVFVNYLRIAYVSAQVIAVLIYLYITQVVSCSASLGSLDQLTPRSRKRTTSRSSNTSTPLRPWYVDYATSLAQR